MIAAVVAGVLAGLGVAMPVGAVGVFLIGLSARTTRRVAAAAALGVAAVDGLYALIAVLGGAGLARIIVPLAEPLGWLAFLVLLAVAGWIVLRTIRDHGRGAAAGSASERGVPAGGGVPGSPARAFALLFAMTAVNPLTVLYFVAVVVGGRVSAVTGIADRTGFVIAAFAASAGWQLLLASGGRILGRLLAGRRGRLVTGLGAGALIILLAMMGSPLSS